jgi:GcrA cell cycle regulator
MTRGFELSAWTNARVDRLTVLVADGRSSSEIAAELGGGLTRNAIIGKATRLGLRLKGVGGKNKGRKPRAHGTAVPNAIRAIAERKKRPKAAAPAKVHYLDATQELTDLPADQSASAVTLLELEPHHCRWPLGDPLTPQFRFCGAKKFGEQVYCGRHCRLSYQPYQRRADTPEQKQRRAMQARANLRVVPA